MLVSLALFGYVTKLKKDIISGFTRLQKENQTETIKGTTIKSTRFSYFPNITYSGIINACLKDYPGSFPCTKDQLIKTSFWNSRIWTSWILTTQNNCLGFTTNCSYVMGTCINTMSNTYTMDCTCDEVLPICCMV